MRMSGKSAPPASVAGSASSLPYVKLQCLKSVCSLCPVFHLASLLPARRQPVHSMFTIPIGLVCFVDYNGDPGFVKWFCKVGEIREDFFRKLGHEACQSR